MKEAFQEQSSARGEVLGRSETLAGLRAALSDDNPATVENAANALGMIFIRYRKDSAAFPDLAKLTQSRRAMTRYAAAVAIGALEHPQRWRVLAPLLDDPALNVRAAVCRAVLDACVENPLASSDRDILHPKLEELSHHPDPQLAALAQNAARAAR